MTIYTQADKNTRLTWIYITGFLIFVIGVGYVFAQAMNNSVILVVAVIFSTLMSFASYWWSDKIVLAMSGAKEVTHENAKEIYHIVENLCITAGLPVPKIYVINDPSPNAFATGRDPEHAVIAVTTGLAEKLEKKELEGVIAHELSHIGNRDILLSTIIVVLVGFVALMADWFRRWAWFGGGDGDRDRGQLGLILFIAGIILSILAPLAAMLVQLAISRKREFLADADGALLTRYPEGLAGALEKISADPTPMRHANRATAHLFIANPFKGKKISNLFQTHPPIAERVKRLRGMDV
ncbi:MAG: zinc metalloprotease HtpX [Candidatus Moranbacteria bacterium CG_4_10_14_3_um_filter_44_15]|nr:MAG: zinc metalloprotease HtpX [Candidatus Moranbacteria bacterium CG06_land_8_20_14_3_00_43_56]PIV83497.1 MAG: zinc metalloprotease HtpX [Candidatus Moranbacteria bacterium CG17_big_fil_post_rev_8_21_14_2_50_44_12]PIW93377.1 MAG: zinc metalloprotease HtpX [Candidatus Moranbacteria bacterium CG_4_8_14_3_um_filter_43_15]PIX91174.1 MAG: zinc metalloprotease HtpX [Candidatus Moranbacteria bacterium CG_4_10_14_3_um_filter_44_15]PJA86362.1 MAG: zinc metalloprotease HtpX [Candidatus Moranbacteria 